MSSLAEIPAIALLVIPNDGLDVGSDDNNDGNGELMVPPIAIAPVVGPLLRACSFSRLSLRDLTHCLSGYCSATIATIDSLSSAWYSVENS